MKNKTIQPVISHIVRVGYLLVITALPWICQAHAAEQRATLLVISDGLSSEARAGLKNEISELLKTGTALDLLVVVHGPNHKPVAKLVLPPGDLSQRLRHRDVQHAIASISNLLGHSTASDPATALQVGLPQLAGTYWSLLSGKKNVRIVLAGSPEYHDNRFGFWSFRGFSFPSDRALTEPTSTCPFINRAHRKIPADVEVVFLCPTQWGSDTRHRNWVIRWTRLALSESIGGELKRVTTKANAAFQPIQNSGFGPIDFDEDPLVGMWMLTSGNHREKRREPTTDAEQERASGRTNDSAPKEHSVPPETPPVQPPAEVEPENTVSMIKPIIELVAGEQSAGEQPPMDDSLPIASAPPQVSTLTTTTAIESTYEQFPVSIRNRIASEVVKHPQAVVVVLSWTSQCPHADLNLDFSRFRYLVQNAPRGSGAVDLETIEWAILDDLSPLETGGAWVNLFETHYEVTAQVCVTSMDSGLSRVTELDFGPSPDHGVDHNRRAHSASWAQLDVKKMLVSGN